MRFINTTSSRSFKSVPKSSWENNSQTSTPPSDTSNEEASTSEDVSSHLTSLVRIHWVDASSHGGPGWVDLDDAIEFAKSDPPIMRTVGWVLHEEPGHGGWLSVVDTLGGEECSSIHKIPYAMIVDKEYLQ